MMYLSLPATSTRSAPYPTYRGASLFHPNTPRKASAVVPGISFRFDSCTLPPKSFATYLPPRAPERRNPRQERPGVSGGGD